MPSRVKAQQPTQVQMFHKAHQIAQEAPEFIHGEVSATIQLKIDSTALYN